MILLIRLFKVIILIFIVGCSDSSSDNGFDNSNDGGVNEPLLELSGQVSVMNNQSLMAQLPLVSWPTVTEGDVNYYEISLAQDDGNSSCTAADFTGAAALAWTRVDSAVDFSGVGYQLLDGSLDGAGQVINLSWMGDVEYCLAVRAVGPSGNTSDVIYSDQVIDYQYLSCKEKFDNEPMAADGIYQIDSDGLAANAPYDVYCDMTTAGGGWTLLSNQNPITGNLFASKADALLRNDNDPTNGIYSIMGRTAEFQRAGVFEFYLNWPVGACSATPHHWTQTSDHLVTNNSVTGYVSISTPTNQGSGGFTGICSNAQSPLFKSNCGSSNWWYAIGSTAVFGAGAPGCSGAVTHVQFWVR